MTMRILIQAKLVFEVPFTEDERGVIKLIIQSNLYRYIAVLLEGRERFEEESLTEKGKRVVDPSSSSGTTEIFTSSPLSSSAMILCSFNYFKLS